MDEQQRADDDGMPIVESEHDSASPPPSSNIMPSVPQERPHRTLLHAAVSIGVGAVVGVLTLVLLAVYQGVTYSPDEYAEVDNVLKTDMVAISYLLDTEYREAGKHTVQSAAAPMMGLDANTHGRGFILVCYNEERTEYEIVGAVLHSPHIYLLPQGEGTPQRADKQQVTAFECGQYPFSPDYSVEGATGLGPDVYKEYDRGY